jgi:hypothetical protein
MNLKYLKWAVPVLCGLLALSGCPTEVDDNNYNVEEEEKGGPRDVSDGFLKGTGNVSWEKVDALSSASILRLNRNTVVYVSKEAPNTYKLNAVDVNEPTKVIHTATIGNTENDNVSIITATPDGSKIAVYTGKESAYETFDAKDIVIYDNSLIEKKRITVGAGVDSARNHVLRPLHHRDPSLALTNNYVAIIWEDTGDHIAKGAGAVAADTRYTNQMYISVYDIAGDKKPVHKKAYGTLSGTFGADPKYATVPNTVTDLGIGTPVIVAINGNYLIAGGSNVATGAAATFAGGSAVFTISTGTNNDLVLTRPNTTNDAAAPHWIKTNGEYAMESKAGTGIVKVWKWNAAGVPTAVGNVETAGSGNIQALSFDPDEPFRGYIYVKTFGNGLYLGDVLKVNLINRSKKVLFNFTQYKGNSLSGIWTIEKESNGTDTFFTFSGGYGTPAVGATWVLRNPPTDGSEVSNPIAVTEYASAVRTMKVFRNSAGHVFYAAKNYTTNPIADAKYTLRLIRIGETGLPGTSATGGGGGDDDDDD